MGEALASTLWACERALWTHGSEQFRRVVANCCVMVFQAPVGVLSGKESIVEAVEHASRWHNVSFTSTEHAHVAGGVHVLAYRVNASKLDDEGGEHMYDAFCSSTYVQEAGSESIWLVQHQHTPVLSN